MCSDFTRLLSDHIDRVLGSTIRNDRDDRGIDDTEVFDAVDAELGVNNTLLNILGEASSSAWI